MKLIVALHDIQGSDTFLVGGKAAKLGDLFNHGFLVPNGFVVTTQAWLDFVIRNNLRELMRRKLEIVNNDKKEQLEKISQEIRDAICAGSFNQILVRNIETALTEFDHRYYAARSSAVMEDEELLSYAGQYDSFLNVKRQDVLENIRNCWSSLFTARAIAYRRRQKIHDDSNQMAVIVQKMIEPEISGVMFTLDPIQYKHILIEAIYGRGEAIVSGIMTPNSYMVSKDSLTIIEKNEVERIDQELIVQIAKLGQEIENFYGKAQDIEFAVKSREIFVLQSRPITT